ncbi:MAG: lysozyme inhibitor LprI family protein [Shimia sp.]
MVRAALVAALLGVPGPAAADEGPGPEEEALVQSYRVALFAARRIDRRIVEAGVEVDGLSTEALVRASQTSWLLFRDQTCALEGRVGALIGEDMRTACTERLARERRATLDLLATLR